MKNIKINTKKLMIILVSGFILVTSVACTREKTEVNNNNNNYVQESNQTEDNNSNIEEQTQITEKEPEQNNTNKQKTESTPKVETTTEDKVVENNTVENSNDETYTIDDKEVINYFNDIEKDVDAELQNESNQTTKDKLKGTFITIVDFLFYDSEINGIKFDDLTEGAKQNILEIVSSIDNKISLKYPNYKEDISSKTKSAYNKASELIKKGANNIKEFSKEKLGEENYNAIIDAKDELVYYTKNAVSIIGDIAGSIWETGKSKIKNWYENFRN